MYYFFGIDMDVWRMEEHLMCGVGRECSMIIFTVIIAISRVEEIEICDVGVTSTGKKRFNGFECF